MAITLPDIVQKVVLDTKGFSVGSKKVTEGFKAAGASAEQAGTQMEKAGKSSASGAEGHVKQASALSRLNSALKATTPPLLRIGNNLVKLRGGGSAAAQGLNQAAKAASKGGGIFASLGGHLKNLAGTLLGAAKATGMFVLKWGAILGVALAATPAIGSMAMALVGLVGSMSRVVGLAPALAGGFLGLIAIMGTAKLMFGGLKDTMKAQDTVAKASKKSAESQVSNQRSIRDASKAVADAQKSGAKSIVDAQKRVGDAIRSVADAQKASRKAYIEIADTQKKAAQANVDAQDSVAKAQRSYAEATVKVKVAQKALNESYAEAKRNLQDLVKESERASISQGRSVISLHQAQQNLISTLGSGAASPDDMISAVLDVQSAELDVADAEQAATDSQKKLGDAQKKGVKNSDAVVQARLDLAQAQQDAADSSYDLKKAQQDLYQTQIDGLNAVADAQQSYADSVQSVVDAQDDLKDAYQGVTDAQTDAADRLADARQRLADATADAAKNDGGVSDEDKKAAKATKAQQGLIDAIRAGKKEVDKLKVAMQDVAFPDLTEGLKTGIGLIGTFRKQFLGSAKVVGKGGKDIAQAFADSAGPISRVWDSTNGFFTTFIGVIAQVIKSASIIMDAARPIIDYFTVMNVALAGWIKKSTEGGDHFVKMQDFFKRALDTAIQWGHIIRDFFVGVFNIFRTGAKSGDKMTDSIEKAAAKFRAWTEDPKNKDRLARVFENGRKALGIVMQILGAIATAIGHIVEGPGFEAVGNLIQRITGANKTSTGGGMFAGLSKLLEWLGTTGLVKGCDAVQGVLDVLSGKKKPSGIIEKVAGIIQKIGNLNIKPDVLMMAVDMITKLVNGFTWIVENVPGAKKALAGIFVILALTKLAKRTGLLGAMGSFKDLYKNMSGRGSSNKRVINGLKDIRNAICDPTACAHPPTMTFLEKVETKGKNFGKSTLRPFKAGWDKFTGLFRKKIPTPEIPDMRPPPPDAAPIRATYDRTPRKPQMQLPAPRQQLALPATTGRIKPPDVGPVWESTARDAGHDFSAGLGKGIKSYESTLVTKAKEVAQAAIDAVKHVLRIKSPSAVMYDLGRDTARGYANGLKSVSAKTGMSRLPTEVAAAAETGATRAGKTKSKWSSFRNIFKWGAKKGTGDFLGVIESTGSAAVIQSDKVNGTKSKWKRFRDMFKWDRKKGGDLPDVVTRTGTATEITGRKLGGSGGKFSKLKGHLGGIASKAGDSADKIEGIGASMDVLGQAIGGETGEKISKLGSMMGDVMAIGSMFGVFGGEGGGGMLGGLMGGGGAAAGAGAAGGAEGGVAAVGATGGLALIPIIIGAIIAGLVILYKKWKPFHKFVDWIWQGLQKFWDWVMAHWPLLLSILGGPIGLFVTLVIKHWDKIKAVFLWLWGVIQWVWDKVSAATVWLWQHVLGPAFRWIRDFIKEKLIPFFQKLWEKVRDAMGWIRDKIQWVWDKIKGPMKSIYNWIKDKLLWIFNQVAEKGPKAWQAIADAVPKAFTAAKKGLQAAVRGLGVILDPVFNVIGTVAGAVGLEPVRKAMDSVRGTLKSFGLPTGGGEKAAPKAQGSSVKRAAGGLVDDHWDRFAGRSRPRSIGAGFKTGVPTAVVGEGSRHPEYVIPTDPKYRGRAAGLLSMAFRDLTTGGRSMGGSGQTLALGGVIPDVVKNVGGAIGRGAKAVVGGGLDLLKKGFDISKELATDPIRKIFEWSRDLAAGVLAKAWPKLGVPQNLLGLPAQSNNKARRAVLNAIKGKATEEKNKEDLLAQQLAASSGPAGGRARPFGANPLFYDAYAKWFNATGKKYPIGNSFRSFGEQSNLYQRWINHVPGQAKAAPPGKSNHEKGEAIDLAGPTTTAADRGKSGEFGLRFPMSFEPWHIEPNSVKATYDAAIAQGFIFDKDKGWLNPATQAGGVAGIFDSFSGIVGNFTRESWAKDFLSHLKMPVNGENMRAIVAWEKAEGGHWANDASYNPLNTTQKWPGAVNMKNTSVGVKKYLSYADGLNATLKTITNGRYGNILAALASGASAVAVGRAIENGPWGTGGGTLRVLGAREAGGLIPQLNGGGIVSDDMLAQLHRNEAVIPLDSGRGRKMMGSGGLGPVNINVTVDSPQTGVDVEQVKAMARAGVEEALNNVSSLVEIGVSP